MVTSQSCPMVTSHDRIPLMSHGHVPWSRSIVTCLSSHPVLGGHVPYHIPFVSHVHHVTTHFICRAPSPLRHISRVRGHIPRGYIFVVTSLVVIYSWSHPSWSHARWHIPRSLVRGCRIPRGHVPPGHVPPGHVPPGHVPPGHVPPGHVPPVHVPPGHVPPGDVPLNHAALGRLPGCHVPLDRFS